MPQQYYTASEAQKKLGFSRAAFFRKVKQGIIRKVVPPGMKQGVYPKRDIDALALSMHTIFEQFQTIVFSCSSPEDQKEEMEIGIRAFGKDFITPLAERISFQKKCEFTFHSLKAHGKVVGYFSLFRLTDTFLDQLLHGEQIERSISIDDMLSFTRLEPFHIYIDVLVTDPLLSHHLRNLYAGLLVSHLFSLLRSLQNNGYLIDKVYTITSTKEADKLAAHAGFHKVQTSSLTPNRVVWELPLCEQHLQTLSSFWQG
ncbi:helix-turn-helix transcriptional regulator [Dictyobacter arantiisoli]|uniref:Helix-turn-helix domain-containing protein n=1 Tax=Dictyobacter arantiisoli TaxID=2014874 RepID=A0A5A5T7C4_9CHLR|nr:helix-turn-helix domain-containing protein [Dictyobacter arantiisoli]GCF07288.1 hypothetical protein KDI_08520 [Dictyobacter arantiisoli]